MNRSTEREATMTETESEPAATPGRPDAGAGVPALHAMPEALLERWMRDFYFEVDHDLGSSGVQDYSLAELRAVAGIGQEELDRIVFHDSRTLGDPDLRTAIGAHLDVDPGSVVPTHGSSEAIFLVMNALLDPGDEVVVLDPCYPQLAAFAQHNRCRMIHWRLRFEDGYAPDLEALRTLVGPATKMVVVNLPHNPTGASIGPDERAELLEIVAGAGAWLVWDGAFTRLTYDGTILPEPIGEYERAVSLGTLSKSYGFPGLRVGWCVASPEMLERFAHMRDYTLLHLSPLVERLARGVIEHADGLLGPRLRQATANRRIVERWIGEQDGRIEWVPPAGGVSAFPRLAVPDVDGFCRRLAAHERVMLVPGSAFGEPRHVRLGFGGATDSLRAGLERLGRALEREAVAELTA